MLRRIDTLTQTEGACSQGNKSVAPIISLCRARRLRPAAAMCAGLLSLFGALRTAAAAAFQVQAETAAQAYQVTSPWGDVILDRRRLMQTLALSVYNLQGKYEPGKPEFNVTLRLRLNADFGVNQNHVGEAAGSETSFDNAGRRFMP